MRVGVENPDARQARIDAPEAAYRVIGRRIAREKVFVGDSDRDDFLDRLGFILTETKTICYAWLQTTVQTL